MDSDLQKVVDIANRREGLFGLKKPLEDAFGKKNVNSVGYMGIEIKTNSGRKIFIANPRNVTASGGEVKVQNGTLLVGYDD